MKVSFLSISCLHCQNPPCLSSCPVSAIHKREEDGIVLVDPEICLGKESCGLCEKACPYEIPRFNPSCELKMEKCDLCFDRLDQGKRPICVEACPMHALDAGPLKVLSKNFANGREADGFVYSVEAKPSIVLRRKP